MAVRNTGSGDYLIRSAGGFYDPSAMTVAFWANLIIDKDASGAVFGLKNTGDANGYVYFYNSNGDGITYTWEHFNGGLVQLDANPLSLGVWTFIALSRTGLGANQTTAYRRQAGDAALTSQTGTFNAGQTMNEEVVLSNGFGLAAGWFPGRIAALKQWSAALTEAELLAESYRYRPIRLANLHSWRPMVAPTVSEAALDFSGNGRNLTPNGALTIEDGPPIGWWQGRRRIVIPVSAPAPSASEPLSIDDRIIAVTWEDDRTIEDAGWEDDRIIDGAIWEDDRTFPLPNIGMTKMGVKIKPAVIGDDFRVRRTYTTLPPGVVITKAWFTVKRSEKQADVDALIRKVITIALTADGQITDADTAGGNLGMFFDPNKGETINAKPDLEYLYDVQVLVSDGKIHTLEKGTISFIRGVTDANS